MLRSNARNTMPGTEYFIPYSTQHDRNRAKVSALLEQRIGWPHEIHTHTDGTLVVCEDKTYHMLLHRRTDALEACGHANWLRCKFCEEYDDPANLKVYQTNKGGFSIYHSDCVNQYQREQYQKRKAGGNNEPKC